MLANPLIFIICIVLLGCSVTSSIQKVNESRSAFSEKPNIINSGIDKDDQYRIFHQGATGFVSIQSVRGNVEERAVDFCEKKGKVMEVVSEQQTDPPYILGNYPSVELVFGCIDKPGAIASTSAPSADSALYGTPSSNSQANSITTDASSSKYSYFGNLSERRIALVIGNSKYRNLPRLDNPRNDAELIATTLTKLGFKVIGGKALLDLDKPHLESAVKSFSDALQENNPSSASSQSSVVALFYYAGHGIQARGENYLIPVDANPTKESDFDFQLTNANLVLRQMESAATALNMVILDACRNNPIGGRGLRGSGNGLAEMKAPEGTLIAFATQSGNVAQDGPTGGNSPFAQALAWGIQQPGLDQFGTFNAVAVRVKKQTNSAQQPWMSNSPIEGQFSFVPK